MLIITDECCVKVSANKLLDHWLNDHRDPPGEKVSLQSSHCQTTTTNNNNNNNNSSSNINNNNPMTAPAEDQNQLHLLLSHHFRLGNIVELVKGALVEASPGSIDHADNHGDTPITLIRNILQEARFQEAAEVTELLLSAGADPNHRNVCGWSALAYSLVHQDSSLPVSRSLLHHGTKIAPHHPHLQTYLPLRVLFRSILRSQSLDNCRETLHLLGQVLISQEKAGRMKEVVLAALVSEASLLTSNGPELVREMKSVLCQYWSQPKPLLHLSLQATRSRLATLKRLNPAKLKDVVIAPRIRSYLSYKTTLPILYSQTQNKNGKQKTDSDHLAEKIRFRLSAPPAPPTPPSPPPPSPGSPP